MFRQLGVFRIGGRKNHVMATPRRPQRIQIPDVFFFWFERGGLRNSVSGLRMGGYGAYPKSSNPELPKELT